MGVPKCLTPYRAVLCVLGLLLLLAGGMKVWDAGPFLPTVRLSSLAEDDTWPALAGIGEIVLGVWLCLGLFSRLSWWLAAVCYLGLFGFAFDAVASGRTSCGCFGSVVVPPWLMLGVDATALVALAAVYAPAAPRRGTRLQPARSILAVGRLHRKDWEAVLELKNVGSKTLEISVVKTTCPCFTATVGESSVPPGGSTLLRARGEEDALGSFSYAVILKTNETDRPEVQIPVRGFVEHPVGFAQPSALLRGVIVGEEARTEVGIDVPRGVDPKRLWLKQDDKVPFVAAIRHEDGRTVVAFHWRGADRPGWQRFPIEVYSETGPKALAAPLTLNVEVVPAWEAIPPRLTAEANGGDTWTRKITFLSKRPLPPGDLSLRWKDATIGAGIRGNVTRTGERSCCVELTASATVLQAAQVRQTMLTLAANGQEMATIPLTIEGK